MLLQKRTPGAGPGVHTSKHASALYPSKPKLGYPSTHIINQLKKLGYDTSRHGLYKQVGDQQRQEGRYGAHKCDDENTVAGVGLSAL